METKNFENFTNLYEVRKSVRFELFFHGGGNVQDRFELNLFKDIYFYLDFIKNRDLFNNIQNEDQKSFTSNIKDIYDTSIKSNLEVLEHEFYKILYNRYAQYNSNKEARKLFNNELKGLGFSIGKIPGEDFITPKKSEVFYAVKFISKIIVENNLINNFFEKYHNIISEINAYNPNSESFFQLKTLNPYTVNRWKKEKIIENLKASYYELENKIKENNNKIHQFVSKILSDDIFDSKNKTIHYYKKVFGKVLENNGYENIVKFINRYESFINDRYVEDFDSTKYNKKFEDIIKKYTGEINKLKSVIFGYETQLIDNFGIESYSLLLEVQKNENKYYFLLKKQCQNLSSFLDFYKNIQNESGECAGLFIESMTFGGFEKLFLNEISHVQFEDGTNVSELNKDVLNLNKSRLEIKTGKMNEYKRNKDELTNQIKKNDIDKVALFKESLGEEVEDLFIFNKKKKKNEFNNRKFGKKLKEYAETKFPYTDLAKALEQEDIKYKNKVIEFILQIIDKKYKVGNNNYKGFNFLDKKRLEELKNEEYTLDNLKHYFNEVGYSVNRKNIDFENILHLAKIGDTQLFQIKSKDYQFYSSDFIPENHRANHLSEEKKEGNNNNKKDLQTLYFESFFRDCCSTKLGADYKIRGKNGSHNLGELLDNFWKKEKNIQRHSFQKEKINNMRTRFTRNRQYIDFFITLNANQHIQGGSFDEKLANFNKMINKDLLKKDIIKIMSFDHGESSFLTYNIFETSNFDNFGKSKNYDNFKFIQIAKTGQRNNQNTQENSYDSQKILDQYITKYHALIQEQKRERQVQEGLKEFASKSILRIKEILSVNHFGEKEVKKFLEYILGKYDVFCLSTEELRTRNNNNGSNSKIKKSYFERIKEYCKNNNITTSLKINKNSYINFQVEDNIHSILDFKNMFSYTEANKKNFEKHFPDHSNIIEKIDNYINKINTLTQSPEELTKFCEKIKAGFNGISEADEIKYSDTPFYKYKINFKTTLDQINNLKKGYASYIIGDIAQKIFANEVDILVFENNILSYGIDNSKVSQKYMGTENQSTFIQALIKKLSFLYSKENDQSFQLVFDMKQKDTKNLKDKQNGILLFVDEKNTSNICPNCGKQGKRLKGKNKNLTEKEINNIKENNQYILLQELEKFLKDNEKADISYCSSCGWKIFSDDRFNDGDDLATYNIAKKAKEYLEHL